MNCPICKKECDSKRGHKICCNLLKNTEGGIDRILEQLKHIPKMNEIGHIFWNNVNPNLMGVCWFTNNPVIKEYRITYDFKSEIYLYMAGEIYNPLHIITDASISIENFYDISSMEELESKINKIMVFS